MYFCFSTFTLKYTRRGHWTEMTLKNITMGPPFIILKSHMNFGNLSIFCNFWNCFLQWKCRISKSNEINVTYMKIQMQHDTGSGSMVHASFFITLVTNYILLLFLYIHVCFLCDYRLGLLQTNRYQENENTISGNAEAPKTRWKMLKD